MTPRDRARLREILTEALGLLGEETEAEALATPAAKPEWMRLRDSAPDPDGPRPPTCPMCNGTAVYPFALGHFCLTCQVHVNVNV